MKCHFASSGRRYMFSILMGSMLLLSGRYGLTATALPLDFNVRMPMITASVRG